MLEHQLKIQKDLLEEGFKKKSEEMDATINHLKNVIDSTQQDKVPWILQVLDTFGNGLNALLSVGSSVGKLAKGFTSLFKKK